jgi:hypothetical protein
MKRFMLVLVMVIMCMSLSLKTVFSYDACDISTHIVPCTVSGVDMDTVFWANGTYAYEMFDWTPYAIFYDSTQVTVTNLSDPLNGIEGLSFFVPNNPKYVLYKNGTFWTSTGGYFKYYNVDFSTGWLGAGAPNFILAINLNPQAGGTVASSPTGDFSCTNGTCSGHFSGDVTLTANPSSGYAFAYWGWNNGGSSSTVNPVTISVTSNDTVTAKFVPVLQFPLLGTLANRKLTHFYWDDTWTLGQCPTGTYKKHAGVDLSATYGESVNAAHAGTVKIIFTGQHSEWADAIVIESSDGQFTTVYWHVTKYGTLAVNDTVIKGQQIATVADLSSNTHFHFGIRLAPYSDPESYAGALPVADGCGYLAFPEKFIDPEIAIYE